MRLQCLALGCSRIVSLADSLIADCLVLAEVSSMVAAMCYAWYLENAAPEVRGQASRLALPMINIPRDEMRKHKDATWLFDACGIDVAALLFADEVCTQISSF